MTTACIMQPTYLPWVGYMDMLDQADVFVLLDTVDVSVKSWQMRNRIRARDGNVVWLTVPTHARRGQPIREVEIDDSKPWQAKHWRTIKAAYEQAPHWPMLEHAIGAAYTYANDCRTLLRWNEFFIYAITAELGIGTTIVRASHLGDTRADKTGRIVDLCRAVDADVLLDTPGAQAFLGDHDLDGIRIDWHRYEPAHYSQGTQPWHPYLSVIDAIAWHGSDALSIIRQGRLTAATTPGIG